jgi:hypothetical protein
MNVTSITQWIICTPGDPGTLRVEDTGVVNKCYLPITGRVSIERLYGKVPARSYNVTYTLDPDGEYVVDQASSCGGYIVRRKDSEARVVVCFLPVNDGWLGESVARRVDYE